MRKIRLLEKIHENVLTLADFLAITQPNERIKMTTSAVTITPWYQRPEPLPFDFIGTASFVQKLEIIEKKEGVSLPAPVPFNNSIGYSSPAYFIFVMTPFGDMRLDVSEKVFNLLAIGDRIVVSYCRGRWTGALKGKIAN